MFSENLGTCTSNVDLYKGYIFPLGEYPFSEFLGRYEWLKHLEMRVEIS